MGTGNQRDFTVQQWLSKFGYNYDPNDPFAADYQTVIAQTVPNPLVLGPNSGTVNGQPAYNTFVEAQLRARAILYYKNNPGDCGGPASSTAALNQGVQTGTSVGLGIAGALGASIPIPGLGSIISAIEGLFLHHQQAIANEQNTICSVSNYFNRAVGSIDAAVRSGQATPAQGIAAMQSLCNTVINGLQAITKDDQTHCDAGCYYIGVAQAHAAFAQIYYPAIAPSVVMSASAPGAVNSIGSISLGSIDGFLKNVAQETALVTGIGSVSIWEVVILVGLIAAFIYFVMRK